MILVINTADSENVFIGLAKGNESIVKKQFKAKYQQSEKILPEIEKMFRAVGHGPRDLKGIIAVLGPGPFTALRVGIVTANALSYALRIPAVGLKLTEFKNSEELVQKGLAKLKGQRGVRILTPFYGQLPNITKKNKP